MQTEPEQTNERWGADLAAAFVQAQGELEAITKGRTANMGTYSYTFADLASICDDIRPVLSKHGLAHLQNVESRNGDVCVFTTIVHKSGQSVKCGPLSFKAGGTPQTAGSAITYMRRYALVAAFGLATEDDDGQTAAKPEPPPEKDPAVTALFARVVAAKGTPVADELKAFANDNQRGLTEAAFAGDPQYAEQVTLILDKATA